MREKLARLSQTQRTVLVALGAIELVAKLAAARDIGRRPAEQIRGSKTGWRLALVVNTFGPLGYFLLGRPQGLTCPT
ncbi:MAG TPA: hypothetical protein VGG08_01655 [Solirubrobacteraceae bacterium]|jgi:hypothetical protein